MSRGKQWDKVQMEGDGTYDCEVTFILPEGGHARGTTVGDEAEKVVVIGKSMRPIEDQGYKPGQRLVVVATLVPNPEIDRHPDVPWAILEASQIHFVKEPSNPPRHGNNHTTRGTGRANNTPPVTPAPTVPLAPPPPPPPLDDTWDGHLELEKRFKRFIEGLMEFVAPTPMDGVAYAHELIDGDEGINPGENPVEYSERYKALIEGISETRRRFALEGLMDYLDLNEDGIFLEIMEYVSKKAPTPTELLTVPAGIEPPPTPGSGIEALAEELEIAPVEEPAAEEHADEEGSLAEEVAEPDGSGLTLLEEESVAANAS